MQLCNSSSGSCQLEEIYPRSLSSSSPSFYHLLITDEGPETGDESDEDIVRSYLPGEGLGGGYLGDNNHNIPAINITLHSPSTNHVLGESPVKSVIWGCQVLVCIKANVYSNLHIVWHKVALWCYWHHCPPDCSGATFGHTVRPDITDCRGIMPSALCSLLQLFIQLNFNHLFIQFRVTWIIILIRFPGSIFHPWYKLLHILIPGLEILDVWSQAKDFLLTKLVGVTIQG